MCWFHIKGRKMAHLLNCSHAQPELGLLLFFLTGGEGVFKNTSSCPLSFECTVTPASRAPYGGNRGSKSVPRILRPHPFSLLSGDSLAPALCLSATEVLLDAALAGRELSSRRGPQPGMGPSKRWRGLVLDPPQAQLPLAEWYEA